MTYTDEDLRLLAAAGWVFGAPDYIHIPDDYDGCMAQGHDNIRKIVNDLRWRWKNSEELHQVVSEFCKSSGIFAYERCNGLDIEGEMVQFARKCIVQFYKKQFFNFEDRSL
jgi:hypothetical protein